MFLGAIQLLLPVLAFMQAEDANVATMLSAMTSADAVL